MPITLEDLYALIKQENKNLSTEINNLKLEIKDELQELKSENLKLKNENIALTEKILQIERKQKKYSIFLYGLKEDENRTEENIIKILKEDLNINCSVKDFRDIYRVGKKTNKPRPVFMEVVNYPLKTNIFKKAAANSEALKRRQIYFTPDYTSEEYSKRKTLNKYLKEAKEKEFKAKIVKNKLIVNNKDLCKNSEIFNKEEQEELLNNAEEHLEEEDNSKSKEQKQNKRKLDITPSKPTGTELEQFCCAVSGFTLDEYKAVVAISSVTVAVAVTTEVIPPSTRFDSSSPHVHGQRDEQQNATTFEPGNDDDEVADDINDVPDFSSPHGHGQRDEQQNATTFELDNEDDDGDSCLVKNLNISDNVNEDDKVSGYNNDVPSDDGSPRDNLSTKRKATASRDDDHSSDESSKKA
ncbi:unnamed protein product [Brassicogethes aeneus]|uniref:Uncharacterized protein n=1 Tax=Brassicogethes aeneus TaxID=1431903 RepID=A0A9P0BGQ1_BRAAE|nr:unnamed protein product [Brassicogethes aeneus]